ncbi:MAG TPA: hypothetical protein ENK45_03475 [Aliiroseovarius sp.]|nr:hypothetical protein [Aliiroseovarius sp.]
MAEGFEICAGCGGHYPAEDGPQHAYMLGAAGCWRLFGQLLAAEYSDAALIQVHRLSVDTYALQHPGDANDRRAVQSVGLHLARVMLQLEAPRPPRETNEVMLGFSARKESLVWLEPPARFSMTLADLAPEIGGSGHAAAVREWASETWQDWSAHHAYIRDWVAGAVG